MWVFYPRSGCSLDLGEGLGHRLMNKIGGWGTLLEMEENKEDEEGTRDLQKVVEAMA